MKCSFSNEEIPKGTGLIYVRKDGTVLFFKNQKSKRNMLGLGRVGKKVKWTSYTKEERGLTVKKADKKAAPAKQEKKAEAKKPEPVKPVAQAAKPKEEAKPEAKQAPAKKA